MILEKDEDGMLVSRCRECVFAEFETLAETPWHKTQIGCRFNRIDKFKARGTRVELVEGDAVSANEIHVFCNNIRSEPWLKEHEINLEQGIKKVRQDNTINWSGVVYTDTSDIQGIKWTVHSLSKSTIKPEKIMVSVFNKDIDYVELISSIRAMSLSIPIFFHRIIENKYERYVVDYAVEQIDSGYYLAIRAGEIIEEDMVSNIDSLINDDCKMVAIAKNEDSSVMLVNRLVHKSLYGNQELVSEDNEKVSSLQDKLIKSNPKYAETIILL